MAQPPIPGQPFYQQPSAPSAPVAGQPYPPQQQFQAPPGAPGVPGQPYPQMPAGDSFVGNLFDTAKPFAEKFGKVLFYIAAIALVVNWLYSAYNTGDLNGAYDIESQSRNFNFGRFLLSLLFDAPWTFVQIGLIRLFLELVINSGKKN